MAAPKTRSPAGSPQALRGKRQRFVEEYLVDLNGAAAAVRAGYGAKNARQTASALLQIAEVQDAIGAARAAQQKRTGVTADQVVLELARIAFADIRQVVTWGALTDPVTGERSRVVMRWLDSKDVPDAAAAAISEVSQTMNGFKVKLHPKVKALELLAQHLGMFQELGSGSTGEEEVKLTPENIADLAVRARLRLVAGAK